MEERHQTLFSLPGNQYRRGCPVLLRSGAVVLDSKTGRRGIRLQFRSLDEGILVGVLAQLQGCDAQGQPVTPWMEYLYTGFTVREGETFGDSRLVAVPEAPGYRLRLRTAYYSDREDWQDPAPEVLVPMPEPRTLEAALGDKRLIAQYRRETRPTAKYCPQEWEDLWQCTCGEINKQRHSRCVRCGGEREPQKRLCSREVLEQHTRRFRRNKRIWLGKNRRRRKWSAITLAALTLAVLGLMLAGQRENARTAETLAPCRESAFQQYKVMVCQTTGMAEGEGVTFQAEYGSQELRGGEYRITATFTSQFAGFASHMPVTITGRLDEDTQDMIPGIPYTTDAQGNRIG